MNALKVFLRHTKIFRSLRTEPVAWPEEPLDLSAARGGGFYAATLGHTLNSRYTIIRKLGWEQHSIKRYRASGNNAFSPLLIDLTPVDMSKSSAHAGHNHLTAPLDNFQLTDAHGSHLCIVYEAKGSFSSTFQGQTKKLPVNMVKNLARQLLLVLDFLHRECHIIHMDIKPDNILIKLDDPDKPLDLDVGGLPPPLSSNSNSSLAPLSHPIIAVNLMEQLDATRVPKFNIQLTDFGTAAEMNGPHADLIQPYALRAFEVLLGCGWDASADIWNLGCLIFEFLTGSWLFVPRAGATWTAEDYHLAHMPGVSGEEFDIPYLRTGKHFERYFRNDGRLCIQVNGVRDLETALRNYNVLDDVELPLCVSFLRSMLRLKPSDRATAAELVQHEWLGK
ncbi:kinase-like domain-containing protein [Melanogaster broomeanus]|nr:kinase-like domain-containing protein [Melanogaster broomeanus]